MSFLERFGRPPKGASREEIAEWAERASRSLTSDPELVDYDGEKARRARDTWEDQIKNQLRSSVATQRIENMLISNDEGPGVVNFGDDVEGYTYYANRFFTPTELRHELTHLGAALAHEVPAELHLISGRNRSGRFTTLPTVAVSRPTDMERSTWEQIRLQIIDAVSDPSPGDNMLRKKLQSRKRRGKNVK